MKLTTVIRLAIAGAAFAGLAGCATTSHNYSAYDYQGLRIGDARVTSGVNVRVSPAGIAVTPRVNYYLPRGDSE